MKLTLALPLEVDVREITLDGAAYYLVPREALERYERCNEPPAQVRAPKKTPPAAAKPAARSKAAPAGQVREGSLMDAVLNAITNAPGRTPAQIFDWVNRKNPTTSASCYQTIKNLEKKGLVEPRENEERGGVVGWYPKAVQK